MSTISKSTTLSKESQGVLRNLLSTYISVEEGEEKDSSESSLPPVSPDVSVSSKCLTVSKIPGPLDTMKTLLKRSASMRPGDRVGRFTFRKATKSQLTFECMINWPVGKITCTAGGTITTGFTVVPSASFADWTSFIGIFDLYKLKGGRVCWEPIGKYNSFATSGAYGCMINSVYDPDATGSLTWALMQGYDRDAGANRLHSWNSADSYQYDFHIPNAIIAGSSSAVAANVWNNVGNPITQGVCVLSSDSACTLGNSKDVSSVVFSLKIAFALRQ